MLYSLHFMMVLQIPQSDNFKAIKTIKGLEVTTIIGLNGFIYYIFIFLS